MEGEKKKLPVLKTLWHIINFKLELSPNEKPFLFTVIYLFVHPYRQNVICQKQQAVSPIFTLENSKELEQGWYQRFFFPCQEKAEQQAETQN